jgi:hypothetical protein
MGDVIYLRNNRVDLSSDAGSAFVSECARYCEGLLGESTIKARYHFDDAGWEALADNSALRQAVEDERNRRVQTGLAAKERAAQLFAEVPDVLGTILHSDESPRHRIDSAKELRAIASSGSEAALGAENKFSIVINLGETVERYGPFEIKANNSDPDDTGRTPITIETKPNGGEHESF